MGNYFAQLPAYKNPDNAELNFNPLNQAVQNFGETNRANAMAEYQAGQHRKAEGRANAAASRAQQTFDMEKHDRAMGKLVGIAQMIDQEPDPAKKAQMWGSVRSSVKDFDADLTGIGVDPADHINGPKFLIAQQRGYVQPRDPLDVQFKQAQINKLNREADPASNTHATPDIKNYEYARGQGFHGTFDDYQRAQSEAKVPNGIKTDALRAQGAFTALDKELDNYAALVSKTGAAMLPGQEKDQVIQARRNLQLQMKELYNLGVLNGPDLALMDSMLPDPTINNPLEITNAYHTGSRTAAAVSGLKAKMRELRDSKLGAAGMSVPQDAVAKLPDPLGIR